LRSDSSSIFSCITRRSTSSISVGSESISMRIFEAASSDQVDRLVGQEAVGDVAIGERRGGDQRAVLDRDAVVQLVALLQPAQDREVSSTVGSPTVTGWKRRSSAASFSMYLVYSSSVVAPTARSSPRASIG